MWNWQQKTWPEFTYQATSLDAFERDYAYRLGHFQGVLTHIDTKEELPSGLSILQKPCLMHRRTHTA